MDIETVGFNCSFVFDPSSLNLDEVFIFHVTMCKKSVVSQEEEEPSTGQSTSVAGLTSWAQWCCVI